ncbi:MAG: DUF1631 family protein [Pseudomonadales bacterium]|nr:DUF1631 family protein [Pseudomonadales bacterium]MBO6594569.1 DUF1631 family protein [Pseudomonadales bacterium]MBO6655496.1 DUF1631 family protein [Pseudomonadales bacterium]MBO6701072.1 DUF1631 family protein [Pseudomonadales bacterium]MBO6821870.1 DUF1631 family protein [Pseudomonadales bacterium]
MSVNARQVIEALKSRYAVKESASVNVNTEDVTQFLRNLNPDQIPKDHGILETVAAQKTEWVLAGQDIAILHSIRDCMAMVFRLVDLEEEIAVRLRQVTPLVSADLLEDPCAPLNPGKENIFTIVDLLMDATIGWSADQGRAGEKLLMQVDEVFTGLTGDTPDYVVLQNSLNDFLGKEKSRIQKLEERLAASESGKLRSQRGRTIAVESMNNALEGKLLTQNMVNFLKGPWHESLQLIAITKGVESDEWIRATKLTETIIWTLQPISEADLEKANAAKQRLYRIMEHLPGEIEDLLLAVEQGSDAAQATLETIEEDHVNIISGQELEYVDFDLFEVEGTRIAKGPAVSRILLKKVNNLEPGQWFTYEDNDKIARIKLVLKLEDVKQLLFTNRNGMKALEKNYDEMAYLLSSGVIKPLNHASVFSSTFSTIYEGLIEEHQKKLKAAKQADQEEAEREAARQKAIEEAKALARSREEEDQRRKEEEKEKRIKKAREEAAKSENRERVAEITEAVANLNIGARLKLPAADGELEECKLAVRVAAADKMIFVNRTGIKVGDYTSEQLTTLLVAGEGEIDDAGVEFEDTLAQVVSKLRQDRDKSYDDLTGSES